MTAGVIYNKLGKNDLEQYHKIRLECLRNHPQNFGTLYEEELESLHFKFDKIITENHSTDFLMGAFKDTTLVGICGFIQEKREKTKHIGEISALYVKTALSGQKIGYGLMKETIHYAFTNQQLEQIILSVANKNIAAQNLYKKIGFVEYGRLNNYFRHNGQYETQVFMTLIRGSKDAITNS